MRTGPAVDTVSTLLPDCRIHAGLSLQFDGACAGNPYLQLFVEHNTGVIEIVLHPELTRRKRSMHDRNSFEFKGISGTQARYGHVFLVIIGVDRSDLLYQRSQILDRFRTGRNSRSILL